MGSGWAFCKDYCRLAAVCLKEEVEVMAFFDWACSKSGVSSVQGGKLFFV